MADDLNDLFDAPQIPRDAAVAFLGGLKTAVSDLWLHKMTQGAAKSAPVHRLAESASKNMKGALNAVKAGGPKAEEHARKRLVVRHGARAELLDRAASEASAPAAGAMRKAAADGAAAVAEPAAAGPGEEVPAEEPVEEMPADAQGAAPSPDEVAIFLGQLVSHEFKMHQWYTYYAEMLQGENRGGLVELFEELAPCELEDAKYFLRRLSVVSPNAVIPVVPNPKPATDAAQICQLMLAEEQRAVVLLGHLHQLCGDDPMRFMLEEMMAEEQTHADRLQQFMKASGGTKAQKTAAKLAAAMQQVKQQVVNPDEVDTAAIVAQEQEAQAAQLAAENQSLQARLQEVSGVAAEHAQQAQDAQMQMQQMGEQNAQIQEQAMASDQMAQQSMQEAMAGQQAAAGEADAKMRLAIRVQQLRQHLSQIVAEDPVAEEGADLPAIPTSTQMAGGMDPAADPNAPQDPNAPVDPNAPPAEGEAPPPEGVAPAAEAAPAAPAPKAEKKPAVKKPEGDSKVEVKVGGAADAALALGVNGVGGYLGYKGGLRGAKTERELDEGKETTEKRPGKRRAGLVGGTLIAPATGIGYALGRWGGHGDKKKEAGLQLPKAVGRAAELVTGSKAKQLGRAAASHLDDAKTQMNRGAAARARPAAHSGQSAMNQVAARSAERSEGDSIKKHWAATAAQKGEKKKVDIARAGVAGAGLGIAGAAAGSGGELPKTAGKKTDAIRDAVFSRESGTLPAAAFGPLATLVSGHGDNVGRRFAGTAVGHMAGKKIDKKLDKDKNNSGRVGGALGAGIGNAVTHHFTKKAGVLNSLVNKIHSHASHARKQVGDQLKQDGVEAVKAIADHPDVKKRVKALSGDAGRSAMDAAAKHPAVAKAKEDLKRGGKALAGITAGSAAVSTGTSIYQGNKTRKAIKEHSHA